MKKRTILGYLFTASVLLFSFTAVYYFNASRMRQEERQRQQEEQERLAQLHPSSDQDQTEEEPAVMDNDHGDMAQDISMETAGDDSVKVDAEHEIRTNHSMVYVVGQYDWITGIVMETVEKFPEELIGMTRQELLNYLRENPEYGTLLSFSEHAVYLRKADEEDWADYTYYLILEEEGLMVYYLDQTTLYLDTGISAEELTSEDQELLTEGFYIKDTAGLFDYLQTVTS